MGTLRAIDTHAAALGVRPQAYGKARTDKVRDPIIEPLWSGRRVLAAVDAVVGVVLIEDGEPVTGHDEVDDAIAGTLRADSAILDGVLFKTDRYDVAAAALASVPMPSVRRMASQSLFGTRRNHRKEYTERLEQEQADRVIHAGDPVTFVGFDLLMLDGEWLLDVPLLERKRHLEGVLPEVNLVRRGAFVRAPLQPWLGPWRGQGFSGVVFKAANGRYIPGGVKDDWVTIRMPAR